MPRFAFIAALALCALAVDGRLLRAGDAEPPRPDRPNLIAIVTDDQARWAMGLYDNPQIVTPNLDRIGREGAQFLNAFVATPVCSPSRATYMTGRYPTEVGITDYLSTDESAAGKGLDALTWPQVLQGEGYRTALVGKWHLGTHPQFHPTKRGFDHFMGFVGGGSTPMDPALEVNGQPTQLKGSLSDLLTDDAIQFVRDNHARPFALCLHFRSPHLPYGPVPEVDSAPYISAQIDVPIPPGGDADQIREWNRDYYASITGVDRNVGRLLDELDSLNLAKNTLVIFTSDHGYNNGRHGIETKGNGKWIAGGVKGPTRPNMWDTSIRVPLVMRWPDVIRSGVRVGDQVSNVDMFRTVLGALAIPMPAEQGIHGRDYSPLLRGEGLPDPGPLFGQYDLHNSGLAYMRMIRTPRYKLVRYFHANGLDELYDLEADPDEARNLLAGRSGPVESIRADLERQLTQWQQSIGDPLLNDPY
jgi:arylsulfatase A-like enzyme